MYIVSLYFIVLTIVLEGSKLDTTSHGIFGMFNPEYMVVTLFWSGLWAGTFGYLGYAVSTNFFSSLVIMNCLLLEPFISQMFALYLKIDEMPGMLTWIGSLIVVVAIKIISRGSEAMTKEMKDQINSLEPDLELAGVVCEC